MVLSRFSNGPAQLFQWSFPSFPMGSSTVICTVLVSGGPIKPCCLWMCVMRSRNLDTGSLYNSCTGSSRCTGCSECGFNVCVCVCVCGCSRCGCSRCVFIMQSNSFLPAKGEKLNFPSYDFTVIYPMISQWPMCGCVLQTSPGQLLPVNPANLCLCANMKAPPVQEMHILIQSEITHAVTLQGFPKVRIQNKSQA